MTKVRMASGAAVAACLILFTSCVITVVDPSRGRSSFNTYHETFELASGGTIQIENVEGNIEIKGWEREEIEITARSEFASYRPGFYISGWRLPRPKIRIDRFEDFIKIQGPARDKDRSGGAEVIHYLLQVPRSVKLKDIRTNRGDVVIAGVYGRITADVGEGEVTIENFSGGIDVSLTRGDVKAEVLDLRQEDEIRITARQGNITLVLQPDAGVKLEASAPEGEVTSEIDLGQELPARKVSAAINGGNTPVTLTAFSGHVIIKKQAADR